MDTQIVSDLPTELIHKIFINLPCRDLLNCRRVCNRWKQLVDYISFKEEFWPDSCKRDFCYLYKEALKKSKPGLDWFNLYKSISLWDKVSQAYIRQDEFSSASIVPDEILGFKLLEGGLIGVHKRDRIMYYNLESRTPAGRPSIFGNYLQYDEVGNNVILIDFNYHLFVLRRHNNKTEEPDIRFSNVKLYYLHDSDLYYINFCEEIYLCYLDEKDLNHRYLGSLEESILCVGFTDNLHILTLQRNIYTLNSNKLKLNLCIDDKPNILHVLNKYNLLENLDWRIFFQWMYNLNRPVPEVLLGSIIVVRVYGNSVFVGTSWGVVRIYHPLHLNGEFDIFDREPVKQFNYMERADCPVLSTCPIIQLDVSESVEGHTLVVGTPKKIGIIDFTHRPPDRQENLNKIGRMMWKIGRGTYNPKAQNVYAED